MKRVRKYECGVNEGALDVLVSREVQKQFAERFAERQNFSEVVGSEIRTGVHRVGAFAADLDDADYAAVGQNRRTDDFLNGFGALRSNFYTLEDAGVSNSGKIVHNFRSAFARRARSQRRVTGKRNVAHFFQFYGSQKVQVLPARGKPHDGDFIFSDVEFFGDALGDRSERNIRGRSVASRTQRAYKPFQFGDEIVRGRHQYDIPFLKVSLGERWALAAASTLRIVPGKRAGARIFQIVCAYGKRRLTCNTSLGYLY